MVSPVRRQEESSPLVAQVGARTSRVVLAREAGSASSRGCMQTLAGSLRRIFCQASVNIVDGLLGVYLREPQQDIVCFFS